MALIEAEIIVDEIERSDFSVEKLVEIKKSLDDAIQRKYQKLCYERGSMEADIKELEDIIDPNNEIKKGKLT